MTRANGTVKDLAKGRSDIYRVDPRDLNIKPGFNCRTVDFDPADPDDLALANSISQIGVKEPLTVFTENGLAYVSNGHRRLAATLYAIGVLGAEIKTIPAQTEERFSSEADRVFSQIVRNSGKPLKPIEQAKVFKKLLDLGWTMTEITERSGMSAKWVSSLLQLQAAPAEVTSLVATGKVSTTLAISSLRRAKGDGEKAAADLSQAVANAKEHGKSRATAKDTNRDDKPNVSKARVLSVLEKINSVEIDGSMVRISMSRETHAELCAVLGNDPWGASE